MNPKVIHTSSTTLIVPHGAIYTQITCINQEFSLEVPSRFQQSSDEEYFPVKVPLNDSDTTSQDNWRNKGNTEDICYKFDDNNNSENSSKVLQADDVVPTMSIDGESFEILECYRINH
jgi:hypothetical protein